MIHLFDRAFEVMHARRWDKIAVAVDLHNTVFEPTYSEDYARIFYPLAEETLQLMSDDQRIIMYRYSCIPSEIHGFYQRFFSNKKIEMHSPEYAMDLMGVKSNNYQDFSKKPYFNVLLDDKAGFDPDRDWALLNEYFKR